MRQLMCVPSISENVAQKLYERFGTLTALQTALREKNFPRIALDERRTLGKVRKQTLMKHLL